MMRVDKDTALCRQKWAVHVAVKAATTEHRLRVATATGEMDAGRMAAVRAIEELVEAARAAARRQRGLRGLWEWWWGTAVARAHQSLHTAEVFLVNVLPEQEVEALVPKVVARAEAVLPRGDPRRVQVDALRTEPWHPSRTAALQRVMDVAFSATDQLHMRVHDFRNVLLVAAGLIALLMGLLVWVVADHPSAMPMCFDPAARSPGDPLAGGDTAAWQEVHACPSGDRLRPGGGDVLIVAGLGLLGGALAAAFAIRKIRGTSTPYEIPIALALLKVPSGSLTAVAGILLLSGGFVPGLSALDSQPQILAYALVFGYAQQLATRFIDDQAQTILDSVPGKEPESNQPELRWSQADGRQDHA